MKETARQKKAEKNLRNWFGSHIEVMSMDNNKRNTKQENKTKKSLEDMFIDKAKKGKL